MATLTPITSKAERLKNNVEAALPPECNKSKIYDTILEYINSVIDEKVATILLEFKMSQEDKFSAKSSDSEPDEKIRALTGSKRRRSKKTKSKSSQKTPKFSEVTQEVQS